MELPILIERTPTGRFNARLGDPFHLSVDADDEQGAIKEILRLVESRLRAGAKLAVLTMANGVVQGASFPFPADDTYKTDWVYRELEEQRQENRRQEESVGP